MRTKDFPILKKWTERKSEKYTFHDIQNEILSLMAHEIVRNLSDEIRKTFFATICDEYTDVSNKEQLTICLRWVDDYLESHEDFMGFYELTNIKGETIIAAIKDALLRTQLSLDKCRGQCYDGASNMLGKKSGVATQISYIQPKAVVTHCHFHSLNLSVKETTKESKLLTDIMSVTSETAALIKYSPKREQQLRSIKLMYEDSTNSISKLSTTRWTVRANSFERVIENYESLSHLWDVSLDESGLTDDIKGKIVGCKSKMESFDFCFGLKVGKMLLSHTDKLSQTLQRAKMSAASSKRLAMLIVHTLSSLRNEETFNTLYDLRLKETERIQSINPTSLKRKRKYPNYSILQYVEGWQSKGQSHLPDSPRDHYRQENYNVIEVLTSSLRDRFDQPSFLVFQNLESLMIKAIKDENFSCELKFVKERYDADIDTEDLTIELSTLKLLLEGKDITHFQDFLKEIKLLKGPERHYISNVTKMCKLLAVNSASSTTGERTFLLARRVKNWIRSPMLPAPFNSVSILNFHKERTDRLDIIKIANASAQANDNRLRLFEKFIEADLVGF